jgi:hypothetical protein
VEVHKSDVILVQETMGEGDKVIGDLGKLLKHWDLKALDAVGNSRGLLTSWKKSIPLIFMFLIQVSRQNSYSKTWVRRSLL